MEHAAARTMVRLATPEDVPQLAGLLSRLFAQEEDFVPDTARQTRGLLLILEQPAVGLIFCAEKGDAIVGMASILFTISTAEGGRVAWLEDMIVHPDMRGHGIGDLLLREALRGAQDAGCTRITLLTDATNSAAQRFYARTGFVSSGMVPLRLKMS